MAPLPQSNTERWWVVYTNNGTTHRTMLRVAGTVTNVSMSAVFEAIFSKHSAQLNATTILGLEFSVLGSNVRNSATYVGTTAWGLGTELDTDGRARTWSYTGRSTDGRKVRLFIFGVKSIGEGDYRVDSSESSIVLNQVAAMNGAAGAYRTISGLPAVWHAYANVGYNDHWIKEYRKG